MNNIERRFIKLLSGAIVTNIIAPPQLVSAIENNISATTEFHSVSTKSIKIGTVNTTALNVRKGSSTSYSIIGCLLEGSKVEIISTTSNGWYKINYGSSYGYVNSKYVKVNNSITETTTSKTGTVNTTTLNVRKGASTSYSKIGSLSKGTKVTILATTSNGWYKIKFNSSYGYVCGDYISIYTSSNSTTENTTSKTGTVNTAALNVRKGASTSYSKIGSLSKGTKVTILATTSNGWYKIKFNSSYGYVCGDYISIYTSSNSTTERTNLDNFLFIGDSFTYLIKDTIKAKNNNVYIYAKSGSMPGYWLDKINSMPLNSQVDGIILLTGVNGASYESNKTDVKNLINKLSNRYPNKTIYVQKIFPVAKTFPGANPDSFNKSIDTLNSVIKSHVSTVPNAKFIDTTTGFVDSNGYLIKHNGDGLHIAASYNNTFYNNILNAVKVAERK